MGGKVKVALEDIKKLLTVTNLLCKSSLSWTIFWTLALLLFKSSNLLFRKKCELAQQGPNNSIRNSDKKLVKLEDGCFRLIQPDWGACTGQA